MDNTATNNESLATLGASALEQMIGRIVEQRVQAALQTKSAGGGDQPPGPPTSTTSAAEPNDGDRITVAKIAKLFLEEKKLKLRSGASRARWAKEEFYVTLFVKDYGHKPIADCRNGDLTRFLLDHPEWVSPHTKQDAVGVIVRAFRWAQNEHYITANPFHRPRGLWSTPQPREAIEYAEFRRILDLARELNGRKRQPTTRRRRMNKHPEAKRKSPSATAFRVALWFLWETGCRTCEMRSIEWGFLDWEAGVVRLKKHKTDRTGHDRIIPLSNRALRLLRILKRHARTPRRRPRPGNMKHFQNGDFVFLNGRGRAWTCGTFSKLFRRFAKMAGVRDDVSAYSLRHGFTVQALQNGVGERQLADVLGQESTRFISWYGRKTRSQAGYLRNIVDQVHQPKKNSGPAQPNDNQDPKPESK